MDEKNHILGVLERRVSKKSGTIYYCINCYAKNKKGELKCISTGSAIYVTEDKKELLEEVYGITPKDIA